jgi:hypothetical protein
MSIILKKKKGLLLPKSKPPTPAQILGNLGMGSILGASLNKEVDCGLMESMIEETIQRLIMEKMLLHSVRLLRSLDYFVSYYLHDGEKKVKSLYVKKRIWLDYIKIDQDEMLATGAKPEEFVSFLKKKRCKKVKISREQLENMI